MFQLADLTHGCIKGMIIYICEFMCLVLCFRWACRLSCSRQILTHSWVVSALATRSPARYFLRLTSVPAFAVLTPSGGSGQRWHENQFKTNFKLGQSLPRVVERDSNPGPPDYDSHTHPLSHATGSENWTSFHQLCHNLSCTKVYLNLIFSLFSYITPGAYELCGCLRVFAR